MATEPKLLALDEPAAGMNATETASLSNLLRDIRADGTTILLSRRHEAGDELVRSRARARLRKKIAEGPAAVVQKDPAVIAAYLGGDVALTEGA